MNYFLLYTSFIFDLKFVIRFCAQSDKTWRLSIKLRWFITYITKPPIIQIIFSSLYYKSYLLKMTVKMVHKLLLFLFYIIKLTFNLCMSIFVYCAYSRVRFCIFWMHVAIPNWSVLIFLKIHLGEHVNWINSIKTTNMEAYSRSHRIILPGND